MTIVGGKGANLGELSKIAGILVPEGFCVTTEAYKEIIENNEELNSLLGELAMLKVNNRAEIAETSANIRKVIEAIPIPQNIINEITKHLEQLGEKHAFAVRSSATAEDLPNSSFAGQQDTYLNIIGKEIILKHISNCWASLFTERAVIYRIQNGFDHLKVQLSVVVQKMIFPDVAGIMFTADPVSGNRKVSSIDAGFGLGEALVSGLVNPDIYKVYNGKIIDKKISVKKLASYALKDGGTKEQQIDPEHQDKQALTDEQILQLDRIGRKIEKHFGSPQDIEWCLADDTFYIVQSRPITTLYPIPEAHNEENHVYVSVGHQQMMTDAMRPLGLSLWQLTAFRPMFKAGGRLYIDVTQSLATTTSRKILIDVMGEHDPLIKDALIAITEREDFIKPQPDDQGASMPIKSSRGKSVKEILAPIGNDPAIVFDLVSHSQAFIEQLKQNIQTKSGPDVFDSIVEGIAQLRKTLSDQKSRDVIVAAIDASAWLNDHMKEWLGEKNVADALSQSVPNNITSEMGHDLLDVADDIRPYPEVINYLQHTKDDNFLDELLKLNGGREVQSAINNYLIKYGMRCSGEIDITNNRWSEKPAILIPMILNNIKNFEPDEGSRKFEQGLHEASKKEQELLAQLRQLPDGEQKVRETKQMISLLRNYIGYREYPKYGIISSFFVCKQALMKEAEKLTQAGVINERKDVYYFTFEEFREAVQTNKADRQLIEDRKEEHKLFQKLTPPV